MSYFFRNIASRTMGVIPFSAWTLAATSAVAVVVQDSENDTTNTDNAINKATTTAVASLERFRTSTASHYNSYNYSKTHSIVTYCDAAMPRMIPQQKEEEDTMHDTLTTTTKIRPGGQMLLQSRGTISNNRTDDDDDEEVYYHNLFPLRQLFRPAVEYPLWDENWDERQMPPPPPPPPTSSDANHDDYDHYKKHIRQLRKNGITRHIILIRHGQYDETHKEDETRILTPLGREQAHLTGKRIAEMIQGAEETFGSPCRVKALRVSNLTRAKETADIIALYLPSTVPVIEPDPMLNEGRPCHTIPGGRMSQKDIETTDAHHPRIEGAFRKYVHRAPEPLPVSHDHQATTLQQQQQQQPESKHEFEIIVCHANVIRYIMCRALQLPPEAWLRFCPFNCSLTYLTIRPTGTVSCRMIGDIGHLPYSASTFSGHHGYNW